MRVVSSMDDDVIVLVSTPGVSLIGDNCDEVVRRLGLESRVAVLDADLISLPLCTGVDRTLARLIKWAGGERKEVRKGTVNLIGMSTTMRDWRSALEDLTQLVEAMGLKVGCTPGVGCSIDDLRESLTSECNIVICEEYCHETCMMYESMGVPTVNSGSAPVGPVAIREWIQSIADFFGNDPSPAFAILDKVLERVSDGMRATKGSESLRGRSLAIEGDASVILPMVEWMHSALALIPIYVRVYDGCSEDQLRRIESFLEGIGCLDALTDELPRSVQIMMADGNTAKKMEIAEVCTVGVDIGFPSLYDTDFMAKSPMGTRGILYIMERAINSRPLMG